MASGRQSKEYQLAVKIAGSVSSSFNSAMGEAGQKMTDLGNIAAQAAKVAAAAWGALKIGEFISSSVDTYKTFEQSMAQTGATAGATAEEYAAMRQAALAMGRATSKTAAESADALGYMALAGWNVQDSIAGLEPILRLSEATGMDLAHCSDMVTDSMSALGLEVKDLSGYLDVAAMANNKSNQTAEQLMEAYIAVGGTMKNLKVPIQESGAALGVLANRGIKGSEAGTALNAVMANLTTGAGQAGKMMSKLGISAFDSNGKFIGLEETIRQVYLATKDMTEEQRNAALAAIGGKEHTDALNALMAGLTTTTAEGVSEWNALADSLYNSEGAMATMAATVTDTWEGAKARLDSAIDDLKINLVSTFAPYAKDAINGVAEYIPRITEAVTSAAQSFIEVAIPKITAFKDRAVELFGMASEGIGKVVSEHSSTFEKLGELGTRLGAIFADIQEKAQPVLDWIFSTGIPNVVDGLLTIVDKLADLGIFLAEHKGLVIAAIAAYAGFKAVTGFGSLLENLNNANKQFERFERVTRNTSLAAVVAKGKLSPLSVAFGVLTGKIKLAEVAQEAYKAKLASLSGGFKVLGSMGKTVFGALKSGALAVGGAIKAALAPIGAFIAANPITLVIAAIAAVVAGVVLLYNKCEWFRNAVDKAISAVVGFFQNAGETIKAVWQAIPAWFQAHVITPIREFFSGLRDGIQNIWQGVAGWFQSRVIQSLVNFFSPIVATVSGIFRGCWIIIQAVWKAVSGWFQTNVIQPLVSGFNTAVQTVSNFFSGLWSGIQAIWTTVSAWFQTNVLTPLTSAFSTAVAAVSNFFSGLWSGIQFVWMTVSNWFQMTVLTPLVNFFNTAVQTVSGFFTNLWSGIVSVWQAAGAWFQNSVVLPIQNAFQSLSDFVRGIFNGLLGFVENMLNGVVSGINKFIGGFSGVVEKAASFIGVDWSGIPELPAVTLPRMAQGGIVSDPTILEAGEAGTEAIVPLSQLWEQMQTMFDNSITGVSDRLATTIEQLNAKDLGSNAPSISDLLDRIGNGPEVGKPVYYITYSPQYSFNGEAPSKEDLVEAESMSQEEFNRMMDRWAKDHSRKDF